MTNKLDNYAQQIQLELCFKVNIAFQLTTPPVYQTLEANVTSLDQMSGATLPMRPKVALLKMRQLAISHRMNSQIQETTPHKVAAVHSQFNLEFPSETISSMRFQDRKRMHQK